MLFSKRQLVTDVTKLMLFSKIQLVTDVTGKTAKTKKVFYHMLLRIHFQSTVLSC